MTGTTLGTTPRTARRWRFWAVLLGALSAGGIAAMIIGWMQASETVVVDDQSAGAAIGLAGALSVYVAVLTAVALGREAIRVRLGAVTAGLARHLARPAGTSPATTALTPGSWQLVAAPEMGHYHRRDCPLAAGKAVRPAARTDHEAAGLRPCGVCGP